MRKKTYNSLHAATLDEISDKVPDIAAYRKVDYCPFFNTASPNESLGNRISNESVLTPCKSAYKQ
jgi:hypothetical protein